MLDAGCVEIAAANESSPINPVKGGKSRARKIEGDKIVEPDEEQPMSRARTVHVSAYDPTLVVIPKQDRSGGPRRIDWKYQRAVAMAEEPVKGPEAINIIANELVESIQLVRHVSGRPRHSKRCYGPGETDKGLRRPVAADKVAGKIAGIINSQDGRRRSVEDVELSERIARQEVTVVGAIGLQVVTADRERVIDASPLGGISRVVRLDNRRAEIAVAGSKESSCDSGRVDISADDVAVVINLLGPSQIPGPGVIECPNYFNRGWAGQRSGKRQCY